MVQAAVTWGLALYSALALFVLWRLIVHRGGPVTQKKVFHAASLTFALLRILSYAAVVHCQESGLLATVLDKAALCTFFTALLAVAAEWSDRARVPRTAVVLRS